MSQGTPPTKTFWEYTGFLWVRGGSCPLHVQVASLTAETRVIFCPFLLQVAFFFFPLPLLVFYKKLFWKHDCSLNTNLKHMYLYFESASVLRVTYGMNNIFFKKIFKKGVCVSKILSHLNLNLHQKSRSANGHHKIITNVITFHKSCKSSAN